jgi:hypothetical protein
MSMISRTSRLHALRVASSIVVSVFTFSAPPVLAQSQYVATGKWGNYERLFAVDSPWNSRPVNPVLGPNQIKKPLYNPTWTPVVDDGAYSLGVFMASRSDPAMIVYGRTGTAGVSDPDSGQVRNITIPHWPANVVPATGYDGHADIVDTDSGIVHSFYYLRNVNGKWTASMYSWSRVDGRGWGDSAHWSQGVRASGVLPSAGLIRRHEIANGKPNYEHALAMSLPSHTLANGVSAPAYIYPATVADSTANTNTGVIPLGALIMLPTSFNTSTITNLNLRKVAETLKIYGAYVVDRNYDTPFAMNVEIGANFNLMPNGWDGKVATDLESIRAALRQVTGASSWLDGDGNPRKAPAPNNILSMRGIWQIPTGGVGAGAFDTWQQAVVFPYTTRKLTQINYAKLSTVIWSKPVAGTSMRFTSVTTNGATVRLQVKVGSTVTIDTGYMPNGASTSFAWPQGAASTITVQVLAESGMYNISSAKGLLTPN